MILSTFSIAILLFKIVVLPSSALHRIEGSRIMDVSCHSSGITVKIHLPSNFLGVLYSLNNFFKPSCRYDVKPVTTNTSFSFFLPINNCGILIEELYGFIHFSSVIVLQKYSFAETVWDELHTVSCSIPQHEAKRSFELVKSSHRYLNDNLESWMEFKIGPDVYGAQQVSELNVGDDVLVVIQVKDDGQNKDVHVESCWAYEGETVAQSKYVMQIFDSHRCQPSDWITTFSTTRGIQNLSNIMTYAKLKAFKFPSTENLQISCSVSVCRQDCLKNCNLATEAVRTNNIYSRKLIKRSVPPSVSNKSANERLRLMKATIKALGASLLKNRTHRRSENIANFYKRKLQPTSTDLLDDGGEFTVITSTDSNDFDSTSMVDISTVDSTESSSNYTATLNYTQEMSNVKYNFNLTMNLVVLSDRDAKFPYGIGVSKFGSNCVPRLRFNLVTSMLCLILFCLILTCIALVLYLRKEKKKHLIDNFLLYNFY